MMYSRKNKKKGKTRESHENAQKKTCQVKFLDHFSAGF